MQNNQLRPRFGVSTSFALGALITAAAASANSPALVKPLVPAISKHALKGLPTVAPHPTIPNLQGKIVKPVIPLIQAASIPVVHRLTASRASAPKAKPAPAPVSLTAPSATRIAPLANATHTVGAHVRQVGQGGDGGGGGGESGVGTGRGEGFISPTFSPINANFSTNNLNPGQMLAKDMAMVNTIVSFQTNPAPLSPPQTANMSATSPGTGDGVSGDASSGSTAGGGVDGGGTGNASAAGGAGD